MASPKPSTSATAKSGTGTSPARRSFVAGTAAGTGSFNAQEGTLPSMGPSADGVNSKEIEKLDSWFEGVSQPSQRIQDLVKRKRHKHDALLRQFRQEVFRERSAAEQTVSFISTNLRTELDKASLMVKLKGRELAELCAGATYSSAGPQGVCCAIKEAVDSACDVVQQLTEQRKRAVDAFYDLLLDVEAEHQKRVKAALRKYSHAMTRNGHLAPQRLQPILDTEMKEVSELHLRHIINFGDLRLCLNMHAERDCRKFKETVENTRRVYRERCQRAVLNALQEAGNKSTDEYIISTSKGQESSKTFENVFVELKKVLVLKETYPFSADDVYSWESGLHSLLQQLDVAAKQMSEGLEEGLSHLRAFSINEMEMLKNFLIKSDCCTTERFEIVFKNVCSPLLRCIKEKTANEPASLLKDWKQMLAKILIRIDTLGSFLKDAGNLWDLHCQLQQSGREAILKNLYEKIQERGKCVQAKENRIALVIEKSRQETNKKCLKEYVERIHRILNEVKSSYENMHMQENGVLEQYNTSIAYEVDSLTSSSRTLLKKHKTSHELIDDSANTTVHSIKILNKSEELLACIDFEGKRWYKDIETFLIATSEHIVLQDGKGWIEQQVKRVQKEYDEIFVSLSQRYELIQSEVEFARLAEVTEHENLLSIQREVIAGVSKKIQNELEESFFKEFQIFQDFSSHIKILKENGLHNTSVQAVRETISELENSHTQCKESVRLLSEEFNKVMQEQIQKMKDGDNHFLRSLKLFSDGGTFTEAEVTNMKSEIKALELKAEAQERENSVLFEQKSKECCSEAFKHVKTSRRDLQLHIENLSFTKDITSIIEATQAQLRKQVLALKCGGKLLREQTAELVEKRLERWSVSDISSKWRCVLDTVSKRLQGLLSTKAWGKANGAAVATSSTDLVEKRDDNSFLSLIFDLLKKSLRRIEHVVEIFHQRKACHRSINTIAFHEEVDTITTNVRSKYKLYQEQCIEVWINEVKGLLQTIQKLRSSHEVCWNEIAQGMYESLSISLNDERNKLNDELIVLRVSYQQYQVETMAKVGPDQRDLGNHHLFSTLCTDFEKASGMLSQNIKKSVDCYKEKVQQYLRNYEDNIREQNIFWMETEDYLFGIDLSENLLVKIDRVLACLNENHSLNLSLSEGFSSSPDNHHPGTDYQSKCSPDILCAFRNLHGTTDEFMASYKRDMKKMRTPASTQDTLENNLKEARALVHNKTCEVTHLYEQYKTMAEELRMKWRKTSENIQQFNTVV